MNASALVGEEENTGPFTAHSKSTPRANRAPPGTPEEEVLATVWAELLHRDDIGIHDNFFSLGGTSLISIQIIDRIGKAGLYLTPKQFCEHPTIASMANVVTTEAAVPSDDPNWNSLIILQPDGFRPPLFLIHSCPGDLLGYPPSLRFWRGCLYRSF